MLFRRNKSYEKTPPSQAKKSLMERLVILDADGADAPEAIAEKLEQEHGVEAQVVRVRSFAPEQKMSSVPVEHTIDWSDLAPSENIVPLKKDGVSHIHVQRFEDSISEIDEAKSSFEEDRPTLLGRQEGFRDESDEEADSLPEEDIIEIAEQPKQEAPQAEASDIKFFDILERAREQEEAETLRAPENQIRIIYRVPKRATGPTASRNAIHNELIDRINDSIASTAEEEAIEPVAFNTEDPAPAYSEPNKDENLEQSVADVVEEVTGEPASKEQIREIIEGALAESMNESAAAREMPAEQNFEAAENAGSAADAEWLSSVEEAPEMPRASHFDKVLFPEEYFYAQNGTVIKSVHQLRDALGSMDDATFAHHATARNTNDFANWIEGVYGHADCARRLKVAGGKEDMAIVLEVYLQ